MDERVDAAVCYRHPDRPTRLACTDCGRPICIECSNDAAVGQKCPECSRPVGRARVIDARRTVGRRAGFAGAPVSQTLVWVSAIIYVIGIMSVDADAWLLNNLAHANWLLEDGEIWRMVTHAFLHGSAMHILFNMYALYLFGPELERRVGSVPFAMFYFAAAAAGSAAAYLLGPLDMVAVGASGAIFGLFGAWIYVSWRFRHTPAGRAQFSQLSVLLAINLALPFIARGLNIAWEAHVGGLIAGAAMAAAWGQLAAGQPNAEARRTAVASAILILAVVIVLVG